MKALKTLPGALILALGCINYVIAICYLSTYHNMYNDIDLL